MTNSKNLNKTLCVKMEEEIKNKGPELIQGLQNVHIKYLLLLHRH